LHIASHFKFAAGTEADSFLLLGDGSKLSLKDVRTRVRFSGVDLLTLSACETAFGGGQDANGREIEGFATLAQNRGAKSVLASLWPVSDASTSRLMQTLYSSRDKEQLNKAAALQKAQLSLLKGKSEVSATVDTWRGPVRANLPSAANAPSALPAYRANPALPHAHPYYWAPFILMGNWL
jgi:CHAT domain-containing protein